ncbi:MAG: alpha-amylase [Bdellovibrionales bacterium RIFOXYD1_FULL_44_7]|nr:MAG: alpha-amylase [Bdellovibrionales bacterium RIFOXYD1_FULL_44_7]
MPSVCFYFQVHQPFRLKPYSCFHVGRDHFYFDDHANREIMQKVAFKSYLPANRAILNLINRHEGRFKVAYSVTGTAVEQMMMYCPEALDSFIELSKTGCVEFLGETYYHSLAAIYDPYEFQHQVKQHADLMKSLFNQTPTVFRNTELICSDQIMNIVSDMGYKAIIAEGADDILQWRSPDHVYEKPGGKLKLLLKNYALADDIAFRFSNQAWAHYPLTPEKFSSWLHSGIGDGETVNLFMDYETFGEHQWEATGIFQFLDALPSKVMSNSNWDFATPSEVIERYQSRGEVSFPRIVSWADLQRDLSAWQGNNMQNRALSSIFMLGNDVRARNNPSTTDLWRKLQTSDHFYYMCTKWFADGDVHAYFNPYLNPYEAFINYMNILTDFKESMLSFGGDYSGQRTA